MFEEDNNSENKAKGIIREAAFVRMLQYICIQKIVKSYSFQLAKPGGKKLSSSSVSFTKIGTSGNGRSPKISFRSSLLRRSRSIRACAT